jgi:hypothetical protein
MANPLSDRTAIASSVVVRNHDIIPATGLYGVGNVSAIGLLIVGNQIGNQPIRIRATAMG